MAEGALGRGGGARQAGRKPVPMLHPQRGQLVRGWRTFQEQQQQQEAQEPC